MRESVKYKQLWSVFCICLHGNFVPFFAPEIRDGQNSIAVPMICMMAALQPCGLFQSHFTDSRVVKKTGTQSRERITTSRDSFHFM